MLINLEKKYTYKLVIKHLIRLRNNYPGLISLTSEGHSADGREIVMVKLGNGNTGPLIIAGIHGREYINSIILTAIIEKYALDYYSKGISLLSNYCIYFIPIMNPDGYTIAVEGINEINNSLIRENIIQRYSKNGNSLTDNIQFKEFTDNFKYNSNFIDINRNFPAVSFKYHTSSGNPGSEAETYALMNICKNYNTTGLMDIHSRGKCIFYYRNSMDDIYNNRQLIIAKRLEELCKYKLNKTADEHPDSNSGGNSVNYYSEYIQKPAITIETLDDNEPIPLNPEKQKETYKEILYLPMEFLKLTKHYFNNNSLV